MSDLSHNGEISRSPPRILHVSGDFPDLFEPHKTRVIQTLLQLTQERFDHQVISINRKPLQPQTALAKLLPGPRSGSAGIDFAPFEWGECLTYEAPGRGLFHRASLIQLGNGVAARLKHAQRPDLIVGHKLTIEGIAVQRMSEVLGVPYAITIQGNTDTKILAARPDLAPVFRRVFQQARNVTAFAPWALDQVEGRLGKRAGPVTMVPCPTELDTPLTPKCGGNGLISVFHLQGYKNKNLTSMAEALRILDRRGEPQSLAICGGGSEADLAAARVSAGAAPGLVFEGPLERADVAVRMNAATAFVLPSLRETFGLVFIEALFAGLPIIYPRDKAVSGYFDGCPFAIAVPSHDPKALADAMAHVIREERSLKAALAQWQGSEAAQRFERASISRDYAAALNSACQSAEAEPTVPCEARR